MIDRPARCLQFTTRLLLISVVLSLGVVPTASAHKGPPFQILKDEPAAGHVVEVWADPDIGEARFFVIVKSPTGGQPSETPNVSMWAEPTNGRLERATYQAKQQLLRNQLQFEAKPYFDQRDMWTVGFQITTASGESQELTTEIESTPPGFGLWDLAIYLFPFVFLGGMWLAAMMRRRQMQSMQQEVMESVRVADK